ncbi:MAG: hypothetical protein JWO73_426 [Candidatus Taylorbacteria bacterium]|nr:hypothetical protein [Candidatus Taylorbacteria bacterium]
MKIQLHQRIIQSIRGRTPLSIRHKIGPVLSYAIYMINIHVRKNRPRPHVLSTNDTIDLILKKKLSVIRFGDGEIFMLDGGDTAFQKRSGDLVPRLESIIQVNDPRLLICVPDIWERLDHLEPYAFWFCIHHLYRNGHIYKALLSDAQTYGDTNITRPYLAQKDKSDCGNIFKKLFSIWQGEDVVLIEGAKSRLGVGNNMFDDAKSLGRILCPAENAYGKYQAIKSEAMKIGKDKLVLLSLGPTAKVLAYDLFAAGYRVVDVGHIDMEYEMFLRKETKQVKVPFKYFNEIHERNPEECKDAAYLSQIIAHIE